MFNLIMLKIICGDVVICPAPANYGGVEEEYFIKNPFQLITNLDENSEIKLIPWMYDVTCLKKIHIVAHSSVPKNVAVEYNKKIHEPS